jgi:hypothetical protein
MPPHPTIAPPALSQEPVVAAAGEVVEEVLAVGRAGLISTSIGIVAGEGVARGASPPFGSELVARTSTLAVPGTATLDGGVVVQAPAGAEQC